MFFKRVLHPVGHGAFFTEQFKAADQVCFNVVHDCGIKDSPKQKLEAAIDDTIGNSGRRHVDFLFISHLDEDHVNGIQYMIAQKYVDDQTTFVLPLYKAYQLKIYEHFTGKAVLSVYGVIKATQSKSVFYVPLTESDEEHTLEEGEMSSHHIDMQEGLEGLGERTETVNGLAGKVLPYGCVFVFKAIWEYIPFNLHDKTSADFFKKINSSKVLSATDLDRIEEIFEKKCGRITKTTSEEQKEATLKYRELKSIYKSVGKGIKGDSKININSLALVSQAVNEVEVIISLVDYKRCIDEGFISHFCYGFINEGYGACTYTGDLNLSQDMDFDLLEKKVKAALRGDAKYHLLQIPHHGSKTSYSKRFCGSLSGACFANFHSGNGIFDQRIIYDFFYARKKLIPVTEIDSSRFEWKCWV